MEDPGASGFGESRYAEKKAALEDAKGKTISAEDIADAANAFRQNFRGDMGNVWEALKDGITPEFWRRVQRKRRNFIRIAATERLVIRIN